MNLSSGRLAATVSTIDSWLSYQQRYLRIPAVQAAVVVDDEVVMTTAYGHADLKTREALRSDHRIRVASHSKIVTATAVMQLVQDGRLRLDDSLRQHLPWMSGTALADRTLRQLLSHSAGIFRDSSDADHWQLDAPFPDAAELRVRASEDDAETQGSHVRFKYSNIGYALVGQVIEAVTGATWGEYVTDHIFERVGMANSGPDWSPSVGGAFATAYSGLTWSDERVRIEQVRTHALAPATGVYSTAEDLCRLAAAHFDGSTTLLDEPSKREMRAGPVPIDGMEGAGYCMGLMTATVAGRRWFGHGGGWPGSITRTLFDPAARIAVSILTTAIDGPASLLAEGVAKLLLHADETTRTDRPDSAHDGVSDGQAAADVPSGTSPDDVLGRYVYLWGVRDLVRVGHDLLLIDATQGDPLAGATWLMPTANDTFRMTRGSGFGSVGETLRVERNDHGEVGAIRVGGTRMTPFDQTQHPTGPITLGR